MPSRVDRRRVAGVTVLYRPPDEILDNLRSHAGELARLYVVDNSEIVEPDLQASITRIPNVGYVRSPDNVGVAGGLNLGVRRAAADGFEWLLTMDQDSRIDAGMLDEMIRRYEEVGDGRVAMIAPLHMDPSKTDDRLRAPSEIVDWTMTSGSLIRLDVCRRLGLFRTDLFIDGVDHEYCMRVRGAGYRILRANRAVLRHQPGKATRRLIGGLVVSNHDPERRYYMIRNRFVLRKAYGASLALCALVTLIDATLIAIYENRKTEKLKMMLRGYLDFRRNRLGRYSH